MPKRKKLNPSPKYGSDISKFAEKPINNVFVPQSAKEKAAGVTEAPTPLDDSEIVETKPQDINLALEAKLQEMESKYVSLIDERDEWKKKYEDLLNTKTAEKNKSFDFEQLKSEFDLKEAILKSRIEELTEKIKLMSEKPPTISDKRPIVPHSGFSSKTFKTSTKDIPNGYQSW
jgi:chromosome segregation ATPase